MILKLLFSKLFSIDPSTQHYSPHLARRGKEPGDSLSETPAGLGSWAPFIQLPREQTSSSHPDACFKRNALQSLHRGKGRPFLPEASVSKDWPGASCRSPKPSAAGAGCLARRSAQTLKAGRVPCHSSTDKELSGF